MAFDALGRESDGAACCLRPAPVKLSRLRPGLRFLSEKKVCAREPPRRPKVAGGGLAQQFDRRRNLLFALALGVEAVGLLEDFPNISHDQKRIEKRLGARSSKRLQLFF